MELVELPAKDSQSKTSNGSSSLKKYVLTSLLPNKVREGLLDLGTDGPYLTLITLTLTLIHINEHSLSNGDLICIHFHKSLTLTSVRVVIQPHSSYSLSKSEYRMRPWKTHLGQPAARLMCS